MWSYLFQIFMGRALGSKSSVSNKLQVSTCSAVHVHQMLSCEVMQLHHYEPINNRLVCREITLPVY